MSNMTGQHNNHFVLSLSGQNIDISIINIEEMVNYCKTRNRIANILTQKQTYGELEKMNYSLVFNYTKPKPYVISTKDKPYLNVYKLLSEKYKAGLLIAERDTISDPIIEDLCTNPDWLKNDVDIMICTDMASLTMDEMKRANFLRISADPAFDPTILTKIGKFYEEKTATLMIIQFFVNSNYDTVKAYIESKDEHFSKEGIKDYIDYYELNKQYSYFVYFDVANNKILNVDRKTIADFLRVLVSQGLPIVPEKDIDGFAEMITV